MMDVRLKCRLIMASLTVRGRTLEPVIAFVNMRTKGNQESRLNAESSLIHAPSKHLNTNQKEPRSQLSDYFWSRKMEGLIWM